MRPNITSADRSTPSRTDARSPAAVAVALLALLGAVGAATMTAAHLGVALPVLTGTRSAVVLPPVAVGFGVGTAAYVAVALGVWRRARRAWPAAVALNAVALLVTLGPPRRPGLFEPAAIVVSVVALGVLLSPGGRSALRSGQGRGAAGVSPASAGGRTETAARAAARPRAEQRQAKG